MGDERNQISRGQAGELTVSPREGALFCTSYFILQQSHPSHILLFQRASNTHTHAFSKSRRVFDRSISTLTQVPISTTSLFHSASFNLICARQSAASTQCLNIKQNSPGALAPTSCVAAHSRSEWTLTLGHRRGQLQPLVRRCYASAQARGR